MTFNVTRALLLSTALLIVTVPAAAQTAPPTQTPKVSTALPGIEISVGWQMMRYQFPARTESRGLYLDTVVSVKGGFGLVAQVGQNFSGPFQSTTDTFIYQDSVRLQQSLAGARYSRRRGRLISFAQVLVGSRDYVVTRTTTTKSTGVRRTGSSSLGADSVVQLGAGLTWRSADSFGLRVNTDYQRVFYTGGETNGIRVTAGGVWFIGR